MVTSAWLTIKSKRNRGYEILINYDMRTNRGFGCLINDKIEDESWLRVPG